MRWLHAAALAAMVLSLPRLVVAEEKVLTLEGTLALARERAPSLLAARARIDEARGRLVGASVLLRDNPELEGGAGRRTLDAEEFVEADLGLSQTFELGGRRRSRIASASAGVDRETAASQDTARRLIRDVSVAFYQALYAEHRVRLAVEAESMAAEVLRIAQVRLEAGDAPELDVNLARVALARSRADLRSAESMPEAVLGELRVLLGLGADEPIRVEGELRDRRRFESARARSDTSENPLGLGRTLHPRWGPSLGELETLMATGSLRADLRTLEAEAREAEAEQRLGKGFRWPDLGLGVRYEREEDADIALGTLKFTLPVFERGQGLRAESSARARRLRLEIDAGKGIVAAEIRTAFEVHRRRVAAVEEVEGEVAVLLDQNESMALRAYEEGQIGFGEFLLVRRETLDTRADHLTRLLEAAIAGVELEAAAGVLD